MLLDSLFKGNVANTGQREITLLDGSTPIFSQFGRNIYASDVVQMCIDCIATECSKLTPQHVIVDDNGLPSPVAGDNFNRLFRFAPNELMSTSEFLEKVVWQLYLNYNAFIYPVYSVQTDLKGNQSRVYTAFYPLNPIQAEFLQDAENTMFVKFTFANGYKYTLPYSDVIHIRKKFSANDIMGGGMHGSPDNSALIQTLAINNIVLEGIGKAIKTSLSIRGILKINTLLEEDKLRAERLVFEKRLAESEAGIISGDYKGDYQPINVDPKIIDSTTLNFLESKILRWFNVPLSILNGDYNDSQYQAFYNKSIAPIVIRLGQAFSNCIFSQRQQDVGHEIKFYQMNLELMDVNNKLAFATQLGDRGILTDNQIAALFGMPPRVGGDVRHMSLNYIDANLANAYQMAKVNKNGNGGTQNE